MTSKDITKAKMKILQPDADQYITIYMMLISYLSFINLDVTVQMIGLSVLVISLTQYLLGPTHKQDNAHVRRRKRIRMLNSLFSLGKYKLLIPMALMTIGSLDSVLSMCSLGVSSFIFSVLVINSVENGLGELVYNIRLNKSGTYYNRPTLFKKGNLFKMVFGYNALYILIEIDSQETLVSLTLTDNCDMTLWTDATILHLLSESLKGSSSRYHTDLDNAMTKYHNAHRKSSEKQLVDKEEL